MKKFLTALLICVLSASASLAAEPLSPELLKQKDKFSDIKLFEARSIYASEKANAELLKDYAKNPASYKNDQLFPIAICYLTFKDFTKALQTLQKLSAAKPKDIIVYRTLGSVYFLMRDLPNSVEAYKKAVELGDNFSAIFCASALIVDKKMDQVKPLLPKLEEFAPENLEAMNIIISYALQTKDNAAEKMVENAFKKAKARKLLASATPQSMGLAFSLYRARPDLWPTDMLVIPARAAALFDQWPIALDLYQKVLSADPSDTVALRGMGLVQYRLGDITAAARYVKEAYDKGDKDALVDGVDLFLLSKYPFIWDMFKDKIDFENMSANMRAGLIQYAADNDKNADMFYSALKGKNVDELYREKKFAAIIKRGLDRYASDPRAREVAAAMYKATQK